jgi:2-polyprenyl-6-hydroxyphenyl methylase / 3-demethylubiquinone-9 3-methyltransferase
VNSTGRATRSFYDRYSYNFETAEHAAMQLDASLLGRAVERIRPDSLVLDAGCGTGLATRLLRENSPARQVVGLDLSAGSLRRNRRLPGISLARGDILELPLRSDGLDLVVSRGVIMTTGNPRRAFAELVRVTKPGGTVFVRVYNKRNVYRWVYELLGPVCRGIASVPGGKTLLSVVIVPPFWLVLQLLVLVLRGRPISMSPRVLWNFFADQLLVPHNSFHTSEEILAWGAEEGCRCEAHQAITLGQQIEFLFVKQRAAAAG